MGVLYITYDGAADNLGQSQIIPYLCELSKKDVIFTFLTFEKKLALRNKALMESIRKRLNDNIDWIPLKYHKNPSLIVTLYDIIHGFFIGLGVAVKKKIKVIHGRSFIGSVIALLLKKVLKVYVILDVRGFWPEERVEGGLWSEGSLLYRASKHMERALILNADEIVVLTLNAKNELEKSALLENKGIHINVIPTCVDINNTVTEKTNANQLNNLRLNNRLVISYIGSVSTWYMPGEMFSFFNVAQELIRDSFFLILTREDKFLENILKKRGDKRDNICILNVEHKFVPQYLSFAKAGLAFYKPGYSRKACCPTKFGEYLAQGLPVIINTGIGDCDEIILKEKVGVIVNEFTPQEYGRALNELLELLSQKDALRERCRAVAKKYFSLEIGIERYLGIYRRLMK